MTDPAETPIVVNPDPVPQQVWIAARDILKIAGGLLVSKGVIDNGTVETMLGAFLILGPVIWSQLRARRVTARLTVLADAAPNRVAVVKDSRP